MSANSCAALNKWLTVDFLNPCLEKGVTSDLIDTVLVSGEKTMIKRVSKRKEPTC